MGDLSEFAGAGVSLRPEDTLTSFLKIAQKGSPEVNKRDPAYIEGLEPGSVFDSSTKQYWDTEAGDGLLFIQFYSESLELEWGLRGSADKGLKATHPFDTPLVNQVRLVPKDQGRGEVRMLPNGHQLVKTAVHHLLLVEELRPVAVSMASTNWRSHQELNGSLGKIKLPNGAIRPSFQTIVRMKTVWRNNESGDWYNYKFEFLDKNGQPCKELRDAGDARTLCPAAFLEAYKHFVEATRAGGVKARMVHEEESSNGVVIDADLADESPL
jgi:hypothetical protein